jgi:hypothetical protein
MPQEEPMDLKPISSAAIPAALDKAERYRLLNQPWAAESICLDILAADPGHQKAARVMLLACTDQFVDDAAPHVSRAREALAQLRDPYERAYYEGIICERLGRAHLSRHLPDGGHVAHEWLTDAMDRYARAEPLRPVGDDDAILRWNACARLIAEHPHVTPRDAERYEPAIGE